MRKSMLWNKLTAFVLATTMFVVAFSMTSGEAYVYADGEKNQNNTCLGTTEIECPVEPVDKDAAWSGSYVYFGSSIDPIRFRVLAPRTSVYGDLTMFLDCDSSLSYSEFASYSNDWNESTIRTYLNGSFLNRRFTSLEIEAIATSVGNGGCSYASGSYEEWRYVNPVSVNDKVFLLDAAEVLNPLYGYSSDCGVTLNSGTWSDYDVSFHSVNNRIKNHITGLVNGEDTGRWWLRSSTRFTYHAGGVHADGTLGAGGCPDTRYVFSHLGVAPALNVDLSSVLFSSLITGNMGQVGAEYKLTVIDPNLSVEVPVGQQITISGTNVTIPYIISGTDAANVTRVSVLVTSGEYNAEGTQMLYYDSLGSGVSGSGTFTLPSGLSLSGWDSDYNVYILAEDINGTYETDYASMPVKIARPEVTVNMYRLYNPNSGEHFYTANAGERNHLISLGWNDEGIGWVAPETSNTPVYRLYNQNGGEHHYTTSAAERDMLVNAGWNDEGIGWYSDDARTVPLYRQYNPNQFSCNHNYTTSQRENDYLVSIGWRPEGIGWYGIATDT